MKHAVTAERDGTFSYRGFTLWAKADDGTYWVSGLERWMTTEDLDKLDDQKRANLNDSSRA